jgi:transposase
VLVELGVVEQRYRAVLEVLGEGTSVTEVARRHGVVRQTVHEWLARYAGDGLAGLADRSSRPASCPHQMPAVTEARIVGMRQEHPGWGPSRIRRELERAGVVVWISGTSARLFAVILLNCQVTCASSRTHHRDTASGIRSVSGGANDETGRELTWSGTA